MTPALRWMWLAGAATVAVGLLALGLLPDVSAWSIEIGLVLVSVAAGITAARGGDVRPGWLALAWFVPTLPVLVGAAVVLWLAYVDADPLAIALVFLVAPAVAVAAWGVFAIALVVELVRRRRRRFGEPRPAWKNDPTPPSYS